MASPRQIAEEIAESISEHQDIVSAEVAGPGFINIKIDDNLIIRELLNNLENPEDYGTNEVYKNQLVLTNILTRTGSKNCTSAISIQQ